MTMTSETELDRLHRLLNMLTMAPRAVFLLHRIDALDFHQIA
jgi:DNA-directed RNA polymerase specialized sigma24 family protein